MSEVVTENRLKEIKRGFAAGLNRGDLGLHAEDVKRLISEIERFQQKDGLRTREHNILVQENRNLTATIA
ncbi:hypothetical protein LCGC14_1812060, partial [marine sediment metagenome]